MKHKQRSLAILAAAALAGCGVLGPLEVNVPADLTPIDVTTDYRIEDWEGEPRVTLTPVAGGVRFFVEREAFCDIVADVGSRESGTTIDVYASVGPNPAALCAATWEGTNEYEGVVHASRSLTYTVRVYERIGVGRARLIGRATLAIR